jgi:hypothetical protein
MTNHHETGPSRSGSVVLDLGEGVGALIVDTPPELCGDEIEISASGGFWSGGRRTHSLVRERRTAAGTSYAAVYPGLPAAEYTVWLDEHTAAGTVTVHSGEAARFRITPVPPAPRSA